MRALPEGVQEVNNEKRSKLMVVLITLLAIAAYVLSWASVGHTK